MRPTAFFKSLSGQIERVKRGRPFLVFGDGTLTACKPISDDDLAEYIAGCLEDEGPMEPHSADRRAGRGDHAAPTGRGAVRDAGSAAQVSVRTRGPARHAVVGSPWSPRPHIAPSLAEKAELARIGRYYATESMLVLDPQTGRYDAAARRPSTGTQTLFDFYRSVLDGAAAAPERGDPRRVLRRGETKDKIKSQRSVKPL